MEQRTESIIEGQGGKKHPGRTSKRKKNFLKNEENLKKHFGQHEA